MLLHKSILKKHPERPERLICIMARLMESHMLNRCKKLLVKEAPEDAILAVHTVSHLERLKSTQYDPALMMQGESEETKLSPYKNTYRFSKETYENYYTYKAALVSAGCVISAIDAIYSKIKTEALSSAFCMNRPSGHHAGACSMGGFCFLNNAAIGARYAQKKYGAKKVAIIDWDVHHGNGTQDIVQEDDTILLISLQRHDKGAFYPRSGESAEVGRGKGEGFVVNVPWNTPGGPTAESKIGDAEYLAAFESVVLPITREFKPDLIVISAGFDAMKGDKVGKTGLSPWIYYWMTKALTEINPRIMVTLEGGYNLKMLTRGVEACLKALLGVDMPEPKGVRVPPAKDAMESIERTKTVHKKYWTCMGK